MSVLLGRKAPEFIAPAVLGNGEIVGDFDFAATTKGKYALVFFYPLDFTFVCPSELIALDHRMAKLTELGVEVMAVSVDSHFTHNAWRNTPINDGGIGPVKYTMVGGVVDVDLVALLDGDAGGKEVDAVDLRDLTAKHVQEEDAVGHQATVQ